jgi:aryl carrier-like protein
VTAEPEKVRSTIGMSGRYSTVDGMLTGFENLHLLAKLRGVGRRTARRTADDLLSRFRLSAVAGRPVLLEDPDVRTEAVLVRRGDPADAATARIDAYVVLPSGGDPAAVRKRAAGTLPEYMLPATVTALDTLPLTANGKLDTARLPAPAAPTAAARDTDPVTAGDDLAERLRDIWSEVLGVPVGLDDDFFALGGNSLFAVRIGAALRARGLPSLRLRELYRHPTIRETAVTLASSDS